MELLILSFIASIILALWILNERFREWKFMKTWYVLLLIGAIGVTILILAWTKESCVSFCEQEKRKCPKC